MTEFGLTATDGVRRGPSVRGEFGAGSVLFVGEFPQQGQPLPSRLPLRVANVFKLGRWLINHHAVCCLLVRGSWNMAISVRRSRHILVCATR